MSTSLKKSASLDSLLQEGLIWRGKAENQAPTLRKGALHEWSLDLPGSSQSKRRWSPPLLLLCTLLREQLRREKNSTRKFIFWIGCKSWPTPNTLERSLGEVFLNRENVFSQCVFLNPEKRDQKLWAAIQALKAPFTAAVFCDAERFNNIATRRLLLAAKDSRAFVFLLRPPWEKNSLSSAETKWCAQPSSPFLNSPFSNSQWKKNLPLRQNNNIDSRELSSQATSYSLSQGDTLFYPDTALETFSHADSEDHACFLASTEPQSDAEHFFTATTEGLEPCYRWKLSLLKARGLSSTKEWFVELDEEAFSLRFFFQLVYRSQQQNNQAA